MLVKTYGSSVNGIHATTITIEVDIAPGIKFFLVGQNKGLKKMLVFILMLK